MNSQASDGGRQPAIGELFKAKAVTNDRAELAVGYVLDVAAAVKASAFATSVLAYETSKPGARRNAARTAVLMARAEKA